MFRISTCLALLISGTCFATNPPPDTIKICAENDWAPFSFSQQGQAVGASVDLVRSTFQHANIKTQFFSGSYKRCLTLTLQGEYDAMLNVGKNKERTPQFLWPKAPYLLMKLHLVANAQLKSTTVNYGVLTGKRLGITAGYEYPDALLSQRNLHKIESSSELANFRQLAAGKIDFMLLSKGTLATLSTQISKQELTQIKDWGEVDQTGLYIAFNPQRKHAPALVHAFDLAFSDLQKKGEDRQIFARWKAEP